MNGFGANDASVAFDAHFDNTRIWCGRSSVWPAAMRIESPRNCDDGDPGLGPAFSRFGAAHDTATISVLTVQTASPVAPRPTQRIALLGDAIHAMTPHRGIGANVALKDAVRLCRALQAVNCGEQTLLDALRTCETEMIDYGFRAARTSLYARQWAGDAAEPLRLALSPTFLRTDNRLPPLKDGMFRAIGDE